LCTLPCCAVCVQPLCINYVTISRWISLWAYFDLGQPESQLRLGSTRFRIGSDCDLGQNINTYYIYLFIRFINYSQGQKYPNAPSLGQEQINALKFFLHIVYNKPWSPVKFQLNRASPEKFPNIQCLPLKTYKNILEQSKAAHRIFRHKLQKSISPDVFNQFV
jgi:hypothetical protein